MTDTLRYFFKDGKYVLQYAEQTGPSEWVWADVPYVPEPKEIGNNTLIGCAGYAREYPMGEYCVGEDFMHLYVKHTDGPSFKRNDMVTCNGINFEVRSKTTYHIGDLFIYVMYVVQPKDSKMNKRSVIATELPVGSGIHLVDTGDRLPYGPCAVRDADPCFEKTEDKL